MLPARRRAALLLVPAAIGALALASCSVGSTATTAASSPASASGSGSATGAAGSASASASSAASPSPSVAAATGPVKDTKVGVKVTGNLGDKPALTVPSSSAPGELTTEVLTQGTGQVVLSGQTLVANYLGQTWSPKDGKVNIFDNSYDRKAPAAFAIGVGQVIKGWDATLVGQKAGTRLLLTIPPAQAYGTATTDGSGLGGQTLLFVVDVLGALDKNAAATGSALTPPAGYPAVTSEAGKKPAVTSVTGVTATADARSTLLIKGTGETIDPKKSLALQIVQTDTATGKQTQETWGQAVQLVPAQNVLEVAKALQGEKVGSRVLAVTGQSTSRASVVLVLDVVGQY